MSDFSGKNVWIIGASSGIGKALAHDLAQQGASIILSARSEDKLKDVQQNIPQTYGQDPLSHNICAFDASDLEAVQQAVKDVRSMLQNTPSEIGKTAATQNPSAQIDRIIFLAALYDPMPLDGLDLEKAKNLFDVNVMSIFYLIDTILPILKGQKDKSQLAICGSVAGYRGLPNGQPYSASKAAVINITESLHSEIQKSEHSNKIDVKLISPGFVETPLTAKNDFDMPMIITPEKAAKYISKGLVKSGFEIAFPKRFAFIMKTLRFIPNWMYFAAAKRMR